MKHRTDSSDRVRAFTLTELLVVIAIITILASITIPNLIGYIERGRVAATVSDVKNMELSLSGMLSDAGVDSFQDFLSPAARFVLQNYDNDAGAGDVPDGMTEPHPVTGLDREEHRLLLYRTLFYTLLRVGRDAALDENLDDPGVAGQYGLRQLFEGLGTEPGLNDVDTDPFYFGIDTDPEPDPVFDRSVVNKLRNSYMAIGTDSWKSPFNFWMGPLNRGSAAEPVPLRSFRLNEDNPTADFTWDTTARGIEQQKVAGQPPADDALGYPAPIDLPVYIWSNGPNIEQDAHLDLRTSNDEGFRGGGDDINNWDSTGGWNNAPRPTS